MKKTEILKIVDDSGLSYVIHGGDYLVVDLDGGSGYPMPLDAIPVKYQADAYDSSAYKVLVSLHRPFEDEEDVAESKIFCGLYAGQ